MFVCVSTCASCDGLLSRAFFLYDGLLPLSLQLSLETPIRNKYFSVLSRKWMKISEASGLTCVSGVDSGTFFCSDSVLVDYTFTHFKTSFQLQYRLAGR